MGTQKKEEFTPSPFPGTDSVSRALNDFYLQLDAENKSPFFSVDLHLLRPDALPATAFYVRRGRSYRIFREKANKFNSYEIKALLDAGITKVFFERDDVSSIREYLETFLTHAPYNEHIPQESQVALLRGSSIRITEEIFQDPSPQTIRKGMKVVSSFVNVLLRDSSTFYYLINLSSHDAYTYQHSVGVSLNAIALAKKMKITDSKDLMDIGMAGLLHDVGKTKVNPEIINKPGPLDETEWEEMRQHAGWGYDVVKDNADLNLRVKLAIRHHHEENNGNGYPDGLLDKEISVFAKMLAVADIFNALTTDRTYSSAMKPFDALKLMGDKLSHKFDMELFRLLVMIYGGQLK